MRNGQYFSVERIFSSKSEDSHHSSKSRNRREKIQDKPKSVHHSDSLKTKHIEEIIIQPPKQFGGFDELCSMQIVETVPQVLREKGYAPPTSVKHKSIHQVWKETNSALVGFH